MEISNELNNQGPRDQVRENVLGKIKAGKARMRPKWHFFLQASLATVWLIIIAFASLYLVSFIFFILNKNGVWLLPVFGWRGVGMFLASLPWLLILTGIIFVILLELLVRHYSFAYRKPLLYSLLGIIIFVMAASVVVSETQFHQSLDLRAKAGGLPVVGQLYRVYELPRNGNTHIGRILEITEDGFQMKNLQDDDDMLSIMVTSNTSFPMGLDFQQGDDVLVLGDRDDNIVRASGVLRVNVQIGRQPCRDHGWYEPSACPIMAQ